MNNWYSDLRAQVLGPNPFDELLERIGMAIITDKSHKYDIPHEPGEWVMLRHLSGAEMDEADHVQTTEVMERLGPIMKELGDSGGKPPPGPTTPEGIAKALRDVYDPGILIKHALVGWSYPEEPNDKPAEMLDAITRDWLWDFIVKQNTRPPESAPDGEPSSS